MNIQEQIAADIEQRAKASVAMFEAIESLSEGQLRDIMVGVQDHELTAIRDVLADEDRMVDALPHSVNVNVRILELVGEKRLGAVRNRIRDLVSDMYRDPQECNKRRWDLEDVLSGPQMAAIFAGVYSPDEEQALCGPFERLTGQRS